MPWSRGPDRSLPPAQLADEQAVLVATDDDAVAEAAARWCAALGVSPRRVEHAAALRRQWQSSELVLVGTDLATVLSGDGGPSRRERVLLVGERGATELDLALGIGAVAVLDPHDDVGSVATLAEALDGGRDGCVVVVVGAVGGSGSSSVAACLALAAARRGLAVALVDDDPCAGGLDLLLGAEDVVGAHWDDLDPGGGPWGSRALREALPHHDGVTLLTWARSEPPSETPPPTPDLAAACLAARRGHDLVVVDLPRHRLDLREQVLADAVACLLVVPDDVGSVGAARRLVPRLAAMTSALLVASVDRPGGSGPTVVADLLRCPVLGRLSPSRRVRSAIDAGRGPGSWRAAMALGTQVVDLLGLSEPSSERSTS